MGSSYFTQKGSAESFALINTTGGGGTTVMAVDSPSLMVLSGTGDWTIQLFNASTANTGRDITIINRATEVVKVNLNDTTRLTNVAPGYQKTLRLTAQSTNGTWDVSANQEALINNYTAGEPLTRHDAVYISMGILDGGRTAGRIYKTDATIEYRKNFVGYILQDAVAGDVVLVQKLGMIPWDTLILAGADYYLDPYVLGGTTATKPSVTGQWLVVVGVGSDSGSSIFLDTAAPRFAKQVGFDVAEGVTRIDTDATNSTVLTVASTPIFQFRGSHGAGYPHTLTLISNLTPTLGRYFRLLNRSTREIKVNYNDATFCDYVAPDTTKTFVLVANDTTNSIAWDSPEGHETVTPVLIAGESLTTGQPVYISQGAADGARTAGRVYKTDGTNPLRLGFIGFVINNATAGNAVFVQKDGIFSLLSGLTAGFLYYIDPTVVGAISTTAGSGVRVGYAVSSTQILTGNLINTDQLYGGVILPDSSITNPLTLNDVNIYRSAANYLTVSATAGTSTTLALSNTGANGRLVINSDFADAGVRNWLFTTDFDSSYGDLSIRVSDAKSGDPYAVGTTVARCIGKLPNKGLWALGIQAVNTTSQLFVYGLNSTPATNDAVLTLRCDSFTTGDLTLKFGLDNISGTPATWISSANQAGAAIGLNFYLGSTIKAGGFDSASAWTLGVSGAGVTHIINGFLNVIAATGNISYIRVDSTANSGKIYRFGTTGGGSTTSFDVYNQSDSILCTTTTSLGAWIIGPPHGTSSTNGLQQIILGQDILFSYCTAAAVPIGIHVSGANQYYPHIAYNAKYKSGTSALTLARDVNDTVGIIVLGKDGINGANTCFGFHGAASGAGDLTLSTSTLFASCSTSGSWLFPINTDHAFGNTSTAADTGLIIYGKTGQNVQLTLRNETNYIFHRLLTATYTLGTNTTATIASTTLAGAWMFPISVMVGGNAASVNDALTLNTAAANIPGITFQQAGAQKGLFGIQGTGGNVFFGGTGGVLGTDYFSGDLGIRVETGGGIAIGINTTVAAYMSSAGAWKFGTGDMTTPGTAMFTSMGFARIVSPAQSSGGTGGSVAANFNLKHMYIWNGPTSGTMTVTITINEGQTGHVLIIAPTSGSGYTLNFAPACVWSNGVKPPPSYSATQKYDFYTFFKLNGMIFASSLYNAVAV